MANHSSNGVGWVSCATAWNSANEDAAAEWALGFWSGKNNERRALVGLQTDRAGLLAEIRLECSKAPSDALVGATVRAYKRFVTAGR